jgi:hypothetical protein
VNPPTDHRKRRGAGGQQGPNFVFGRPSSRHSVHVTIEDGNEEEETSSQPRLEQVQHASCRYMPVLGVCILNVQDCEKHVRLFSFTCYQLMYALMYCLL